MNPAELIEDDIVEFTYKGSQESYFDTLQTGKIVMKPYIEWEGGTIPVEDYTENLILVSRSES